MTNARLVTDSALVQEMQRCIWRDEARRLGFDERTVERLTFTKWRFTRGGGVPFVVWARMVRR